MIFPDMKVFILIFMCEVAFAQHQGLTIPFTSLACKTEPSDSKPLTISFAPLERAEPVNVLSVEPFNASKICYRVHDPNIMVMQPDIEKRSTYVSKLQKLNPNVVIASHLSDLSEIKLSKMSCDNNIVPINMNILRETPKTPAVGHLLGRKDCGTALENSVSIKPTPIPIYLQNVPTSTHTNYNEVQDKNYVYYGEKSHCHTNPVLTTHKTTCVEKPPEVVGSPQCVSIVQSCINKPQRNQPVIAIDNSVNVDDNPCTQPYNIYTLKTSEVDDLSTNNKILYPLSNVIFFHGTDTESEDKINKFLKTKNDNILAMFLNKKSDNKCKCFDPLPVENMNYKLDNLLQTDPTWDCIGRHNIVQNKIPFSAYEYVPLTPSSSYSIEQPCVIEPFHRTTIKDNLNTKCPSPCSVPSYVYASDSYSNCLSSYLNKVVPALTTDILSVLLNTNYPCKSTDQLPFSKVMPIDNYNFYEPVGNDMSCLSPCVRDFFISQEKPECRLCVPSKESSHGLLNPRIGFLAENGKFGQEIDSDEMCIMSEPIPYIASITINVMPPNEAANNIIILI